MSQDFWCTNPNITDLGQHHDSSCLGSWCCQAISMAPALLVTQIQMNSVQWVLRHQWHDLGALKHNRSNCMPNFLLLCQLYYSVVPFITWSDFSQIFTKDDPIAHPLGRAMGCLLWVQTLIDVLNPFLQWRVKYHVILDRVIMALDCISEIMNWLMHSNWFIHWLMLSS